MIDLYDDCMNLLRREKERQEKARAYYAEHYTNLFEDEERHTNTVGGKLCASPIFAGTNETLKYWSCDVILSAPHGKDAGKRLEYSEENV